VSPLFSVTLCALCVKALKAEEKALNTEDTENHREKPVRRNHACATDFAASRPAMRPNVNDFARPC